MGTKANPGTFDCYADADDDEEMFIVLSRDPLAPGIVRRWAKRYLKKHNDASTVTERVMAKHQEALQCAKRMEVQRSAKSA